MYNLLSRYWMLFTALILLLGAGWIWISADPHHASEAARNPAPQAGFPAPDFSLETLRGETVSLSAFQGSPVILNFWASWCPPCRAEMPALQNVQDRYRSEGLVVLAVNASTQDSMGDVTRFLDEYEINLVVPLDESNTAGTSYRVQSLPTTFFIDRTGTIVGVVIGGPLAEGLLTSRAEDLLKKED